MGDSSEVRHSGAGQPHAAPSEQLSALFDLVRDGFERQQRLLSFGQYLELFQAHPVRHCRDAATYLLDMIRFFGDDEVDTPFGPRRRYRLFDQAFLPEDEAQSVALVGHEEVQREVVTRLENFRREGRPNRVLLMHGPNGSAKSTLASCLMGGLEHYSSLDEGALYRFHWVFPKKSKVRGTIGFRGGEGGAGDPTDSYAHLPDEDLETKLVVEVRDHPLFLLPAGPRKKLLDELLGAEASVPRWLTHGALCAKNQQIFSALLTSYEGSLAEVLRHVQVERYFISRRYRVGAVTLGPELSVDARERQLTADRNWGALPASLQGLTLYDVSGELVDAAGGILELSDLLKRPIDAFKYLQITAETGAVSLGSQNLEVNCVLLASGNELHLSAFRDHPEFESFRGRFELIKVPYLRDYRAERSIYDQQIVRRLSAYVAPHATTVAAKFAVLTRLHRPDPDHFTEDIKPVVKSITAWEKMLAYAGELTELDVDGTRTSVRQAIREMGKESEDSHYYEGISGVSARIMRGLLFAAAQNANYGYLSPFGVLDELDRLCERGKDYAFLNMEAAPGGFFDHVSFRMLIRTWLLDKVEDELRIASGIVDETRYEELLGRYITHVSASTKGEKIKNTVTGSLEPPDEALMRDVEQLLDITEGQEEARVTLMGRIAAWAIDHPGRKIAESPIYREKLNKMRGAVFEERRVALAKMCQTFVEQTEGDEDITDKQVGDTLRQMQERFGYDRRAAYDAAARLYGERLRDIE